MQEVRSYSVLYYDAECAFCRACARFVERHDKHETITLTPIQNKEPQAPGACYESVIFMTGGNQYEYSSAIVNVLTRMGGVWYLLGTLLWLVPKPLRDWGYRFVGKRRHWFGGNRSC